MQIKILGSGCPRCHEVEKRSKKALAELKIAGDVQKITDISQIAKYEIMSTPGLIINGKAKSSGRIPSVDEIKKWIQEEL